MDPQSLGASYRQTMAWVVGSRNAATAGKLYHQRSPLKEGVFDTDDGQGYSKACPTERHVIGEKTQFAWNKITPIADTILEE
jgi:IS1 family transposase